MIQQGKFLLFDNLVEFSAWLDKQVIKRKIEILQVHHTWSPNYKLFNGRNHFDLLNSMRNAHIARGFDDIAQNLSTFSDGKIAYSLGRPFDVAPAGIKGANSNGICVENVGNFDIGGDTMTEIHKATIIGLYAVMSKKFKTPIDINHIVYHHWYNLDSGVRFSSSLINTVKLPSSQSKSCPGSNWFGGNTLIAAQNNFIPLVKQSYEALTKPVQVVSPAPTPVQQQDFKYNAIYKERVYAKNGKLIHCAGDDYKAPATDVRFIKLQTGKTEYKFVYEKGATVSSLVKKHNATYGINGPYFYNNIPLGDTEDHDKVISAAYGKMLKWHEFAVIDGKPTIGQLNKDDKQDLLFQSAPMLIENGKLVYDMYRVSEEVQDDIGKSRCQRTFAGVDANGDLTIFIADGRTGSDQGLTLQEMALFAQEKGMVNCLNFDGGSSTILADKTGGLNQKLNTGANERPVNHALLIYVKDDVKVDTSKVTPTKIDLIDTEKNATETVDGFIMNDKSYVELRKVGNFLGAQVGWDATNHKASLTK